MFELRRKRLVAGHGGPVVGQDLGLRAARFTIGSMVKNMPSSSTGPSAGAAIVQHVRRRVEDPAKAVAAEIADDRHALRLDVGLDRMADVAEGVAGLDRRDAAHQAFVGHFDQPFGLAGKGPATYIRLVSPYQPSTITVTSMFRMSPSISTLGPGIPWQTTWFTLMHEAWR
jgi:hypothetical protein